MDEEKVETTNEKKPQQESIFHMEKDRTSYVISLHFSQNAAETLEDKMKRLIRQDVKDGKV